MVDTINPNPNQDQNDRTKQMNKSFYSGFDRPEEVKVNLAKEIHEDEARTKQPEPPKPVNPIHSAPATISVAPAIETPRPAVLPPEPVINAMSAEKVMEGKKPELEPVQTVPSGQPITKEPLKSPEAKIAELETKPKVKNQEPKIKKPRKPISWRGIFIILTGGILTAVILGAVVYFGLSFLDQGQINQKQTTLNNLKSDSENLAKVPAPLELPKTETPTSTAVTPVTPTVVTPTNQTPVVSPVPSSTTTGGKG